MTTYGSAVEAIQNAACVPEVMETHKRPSRSALISPARTTSTAAGLPGTPVLVVKTDRRRVGAQAGERLIIPGVTVRLPLIRRDLSRRSVAFQRLLDDCPVFLREVVERPQATLLLAGHEARAPGENMQDSADVENTVERRLLDAFLQNDPPKILNDRLNERAMRHWAENLLCRPASNCDPATSGHRAVGREIRIAPAGTETTVSHILRPFLGEVEFEGQRMFELPDMASLNNGDFQPAYGRAPIECAQ